MRKPIFYVYEPTSGYTRFQHQSYEGAQLEADRLAAEYRGKEFLILATVGGSKASDIHRIRFEEADLAEIPF